MNTPTPPNPRYARHMRIAGFSQENLLATRIGVIGAGAVGNEVVKNLVLLGTGYIDLFDFDHVEIHNLTRSIFMREADVGAQKAEAVAARAAEVDPNVRLRAVPGDFWHTLSLSRLASYTAVVCCVDNFEARLQLNRLCLITGTPLINAAIDSRHASVESFPQPATGSACYECHLPESVHARIAQRYSCGWLRRLAWHERVVPTTAVTASMAGALAAGWALGLGQEGLPDARRYLCDTHSGHGGTSVLVRRADCPACGCLALTERKMAGGDNLGAVRRATADMPGDTLIRLSDALITGYQCASCASQAGAESLLWLRARDFDERIARCPACMTPSMRVDMRERLTLAELTDGPDDRRLPVKYLLADLGETTLCIDLEDPEHE